MMEIFGLSLIVLKVMKKTYSLFFSLVLMFLMFSFSIFKESMFFQIDIFNWGLILLVIFMFLLIHISIKSMSILFQLLNLFLIWTFLTKNMLMFYMLFEWTVFPTFFLILGFGLSSGRLQAGLFFLFFTIIFSLPFLLFIMNIFIIEGSISMLKFTNMNYHLAWSIFVVLVFSSKLPIFFLHIWLPKAHLEAPLGGSMILAAVLLKLGAYGLIRMMNLYFWLIKPISSFLMSIGILGSLLSSISCYLQVDLKRMVAFMSVSHMSILFAGLMTFNFYGVFSTLLLVLGHGLISSSLFFMVNVLYVRSFSRSIMKNKSNMMFLSSISLISFLLLSANLALPPTLSFLSEVHLIWSLMGFSFLNGIVIFLMMAFSTAYTIHLYTSSFHGNASLSVIGESGYVQEMFSMFSHFMPLMLLIILF